MCQLALLVCVCKPCIAAPFRVFSFYTDKVELASVKVAVSWDIQLSVTLGTSSEHTARQVGHAAHQGLHAAFEVEHSTLNGVRGASSEHTAHQLGYAAHQVGHTAHQA
jgi:hypothetical protein